MNGAALRADITVPRLHFVVDVAITAAPGEVIALLGPNGAGKSTVLRVLAGLDLPESGEVLLGDRVLTRRGPHHRQDVQVAPEQRRIGLMGQTPLLFPHLSVLENVAFGLRAQGTDRRSADERAARWLDRLGLADLGARKPRELSGGQAQRVALARALAAEPDLLLLDEPLGALDAQTGPEIRQVLRTHLRATGTTAVLVTHDVVDVAVLADRVLVIERGVVVDDGPTAAVLAAPRSGFGAALAGLNLLAGVTTGHTADGHIAVLRTTSGLLITGIAVGPLVPGAAAAVFSPAAVAVYTGTGGGSPRNRWHTTVAALESGTAAVRLRTGGADGRDQVAVDLTPAAVADLELDPGRAVQLSVKATEVRIHQR